MSEANVEQYEVADQPTQINHEPALTDEGNTTVQEEEADARGEMLKFGVLVVVLLFTVLIIALLRPLIFGKVVPAVLGENQPAAPLVSSPSEAETIKQDAAAEEVEQEDVMEEPAVSPTDTPEETVAEPKNPEDFPTAVPAQSHTVQPGETLSAIARQYSVTVSAIVTANNITNPNRINAGTELIIPVSEGQ
jgi:LysM repeat protein